MTLAPAQSVNTKHACPGTPEMKVRAQVVSFESVLLVLSYECLSTISVLYFALKKAGSSKRLECNYSNCLRNSD